MWKSLSAVAILAMLISPALADDSHHPPADNTPQTGQAVPGPGMMGGGMMGGGMMGPGMMMGCPMMGMMGSGKSHAEGHIAFLKAELQITSQQEKAWTAFANSLRGIHKRMSDMRAEMGPGMMNDHDKPKSAPDAMQMHIKMMAAHLENMKTLQAATAKLYDALSADQKATADELLLCCMGHM